MWTGLSASRDPPLSGLRSNQGLGSINSSLSELAYNIVLLCPTSDIEYGQSLNDVTRFQKRLKAAFGR
jgi:hypothetical protein